MRFVARLLHATSTALLCAATSPAIVQAEPLATRQQVFSIPFRIDPPQIEAQRPVEVQLYVSQDRGKSWRLTSRVRPDATQFVFRAERDGEYWFLVRTKDQTGRLLPDRVASPEMQVVVDTSQPLLQLDAVRGTAGEVTVQFRSADPLLEPHNLRIDYQATGANELWQAMALDPKKTDRTPGSCRGEVTIWPTPGVEPLTVRAEITDRAGNRTIAQTEVKPPRVTPAQVTPTFTPSAVAPTVTPTVAPIAPAANVPDLTPSAPATSEPAAVVPVTPQSPPATHAVPETPSPSHWPANEATAPMGHSASQSPITPFVVQRLPGVPAQPASTSQTAKRTEPPASNTLLDPPLRTIERDSNGQPLPAAPPVSTSLPTATEPTGGLRPLMVHARSFEVDYDVRWMAPNSIAQVELWGTTDSGQNWSRFGVDADRTSPILAQVEREGIYGFRVVVQPVGKSELPPRSGDRPEVWVGVDLTGPVCRLTQVQQGSLQLGGADRSGEVAIAWESQDTAPAERASSLLYAEQPTGPWTTIASGLESSGKFIWTLDPRVPAQLYLRLEVRDQAGNVAATQTNEPLKLENRPRIRVREVRPTLESGQRMQTYRFF